MTTFKKDGGGALYLLHICYMSSSCIFVFGVTNDGLRPKHEAHIHELNEVYKVSVVSVCNTICSYNTTN